MITEILSGIGGFFTSLGQFLGIIKRSQELHNTPAMQKADQAKKDAKEDDELDEILEDEDVKATQKKLSNK